MAGHGVSAVLASNWPTIAPSCRRFADTYVARPPMGCSTDASKMAIHSQLAIAPDKSTELSPPRIDADWGALVAS
jgi:hypothetical protein